MRPSDNYKNLLSVNRLLVDGKEYATGHADDYFVIEDWPEDPEKEDLYFQGWFEDNKVLQKHPSVYASLKDGCVGRSTTLMSFWKK